MRSDNDNLAVLRRLRTEGRLTDAEYAELTGGLHTTREDEAPGQSESPEPTGPPESQDTAELEQEDGEPEESEVGADDELSPLWPPRLRTDLNANYVGGIVVASMALMFTAAMEMLPWPTMVAGILVLLTTLFEGWRIVTIGGGLFVAALIVIGLMLSAGGRSEPEQVVVVTAAPQEPNQPIPGSLGIYMSQIPDLWNEVSAPPRITKGLIRNSEIGEYDTFLYRFGETERLAGAFDPDTEAVYALMATGLVGNEATAQLYLHVCHLAAPYSPECIESYQQQGLGGGALADLADTTHQAEWALGDQTWRLQVDQSAFTLRVFAPDAT
jgi:hypothetical protein